MRREEARAMAEPVNFTFHYGAQSWPVTKEQADRLTLLLSSDVKDGKRS
jgi:hypothetical protein